MKRLVLILVFMAAIGCAANAEASLLNSDFEDWTTGNAPQGWSNTAYLYAVQETTLVKSGSSSARIDFTSTDRQDLYQTIDGTPGVYRFIAQFLENDPGGRGRLFLSFLDSAGKALTIIYNTTYTANSSLWQLHSLEAAAPSGTAFVKAGLAFYDVNDNWDGSASIYVDGLSLSAPAVPIPGAIWLFCSGFLGLAGLRKKMGA